MLKEFEVSVRESSDQSINSQVQKYLQQVRDKNRYIVSLTQKKEEIESKMLGDVNEDDLRILQQEHSELIREYEEIIKAKIQIFAKMIANLKKISEINTGFIQNEETIAERKL